MTAEPSYYKGEEFKKNVDVTHSQWYKKDFTVEGVAREVFEKYSGIPPDEVVEHVGKVRDRAFENMPYACIGSCRFLNFSLSQNPNYAEVLKRLTADESEETFLDLGCCFGHDMRKLVFDGVDDSRVYGMDIESAFVDLGYDLFLDRGRLKSKFITADLFTASMEDLTTTLDGGVDVAYAASFFVLFNWDQQLVLIRNVIKLMKPKSGSMIFGRQLGSVNPGEYPHLKKDGTTTFWHNKDTWQKIWDEAGIVTSSKWKVEATLDEIDFGYEDNKWGDPSQRRQLFAVVRG